jgi:hypothetical protein
MTCPAVRTTRTFRPDLPLCIEVWNCSSLHPSGRFSSTSGRLSVLDKLQDFFPKHSYRKITASVRTTWILVRTRLSIRQVLQFKSRCPDDSQHGPDARASDMEITCIKSTVWTIIPWSGRMRPYMEITCSGSATVRTTGDRRPDAAQKQERISVKFSNN